MPSQGWVILCGLLGLWTWPLALANESASGAFSALANPPGIDTVDSEMSKNEFDIRALSLRLPLHSLPTLAETYEWSQVAVDLGDLDPYFFGNFQGASPEYSLVASPLQFVARVHLIGALLYFLPERYAIRLNAERLDREKGEQPFLPFLLLPNTGAPRVPMAPLQEQLHWIQSLQRMADSPAAWQSLNKLYLYAKQRLTEGQPWLIRRAVGAALNAWYQTFDPHARIFADAPVYMQAPRQSFSNQLAELQARSIENPKGYQITYVRLQTFHDAAGALLETIRRSEAEGTRLFLFDVRDNPGGLVDDLNRVLNVIYFGEQPVELFHVTRSRDQSRLLTFFSFRSGDTRLPIIVLQNASTKSTAEMFSGILQFHKRAWILGDHSFGKGAYLEARNILGGRALLYETTKLLHFPYGGSPQLNGVSPDFLTLLDPSAPRVVTRYPNPLPRDPRFFTQSRYDEIMRISECANAYERLNQRQREEAVAAHQAEDYMIYRASLVGTCVLDLAERPHP